MEAQFVEIVCGGNKKEIVNNLQRRDVLVQELATSKFYDDINKFTKNQWFAMVKIAEMPSVGIDNYFSDSYN